MAKNTKNENQKVDPKLLEILVCPITKSNLIYIPSQNELISKQAKLAFPIKDGIPIMLEDEARELDEKELWRMTEVKEIRLSKSKDKLVVLFKDDFASELTAELLRVESPSAEVQGHGFGQKKTPFGKKYIKIVSIDTIGNYAVRIKFDDGHETGIYSWEFLHNLSLNKSKIWESYLKRLKEKKLSRTF